MRKFILSAATAALAVTAFSTIGSTPSKAGTVCLTEKEGGGFSSCAFYSYAECRASQAGIGGSCVRNPRPDYGDAYGYDAGPGVAVEVGPSPYSGYNSYYGPGYARPGVRIYGGF